MNGVYGALVGRLDVRLIRGDSQRLGGRWRRRNPSTGEIVAVDLGAWRARVELRSPDGVELWMTRACDEMTDDGYAVANIAPSAFQAGVWAARRSGRWRCVAVSPDGAVVRTIGWGYWMLGD